MPFNLVAAELPLEAVALNDDRTSIVSFELLSLNIEEQVVPFNTNEAGLNLPVALYATVHVPCALGGDPEEIEFYEISVEWFSSPSFDGRVPGYYVFTPVFDNALYVTAITPPTILIFVEDESVITEIIAFAPFSTDIETQTVPIGSVISDINLPLTIVTTLRFTFSDPLAPNPTEEVDVYANIISWEGLSDWDSSMVGATILTPTIHLNCPILSTVAIPYITIYVCDDIEPEYTVQIISFVPFSSDVERQMFPLGSNISEVYLPSTLAFTLLYTFTDPLSPNPTEEVDIVTDIIAWNGLNEWNGNVTGSYILISVIDVPFALAPTLSLPQITTFVFDEDEYEEMDVEIINFSALPVDISLQEVPFGTYLFELYLPDSIEANVRFSGDYPFEPFYSDIFIQSSWSYEPVFDGNVSGTYIFTAIPTDVFPINTNANIPTITVIVGDAPIEEVVITLFDELEFDVAFQEFILGHISSINDIVFPNRLRVVSGGVSFYVDVIEWVATPDFYANAINSFVFTPNLPDDYTIEDGVALPLINVTITEETDIGVDDRFDRFRRYGEDFVYSESISTNLIKASQL